MLVLTRKPGEAIRLDDDIVIKVLEVQGVSVRIGVDAPREVSIHRDEVYARIQAGDVSVGVTA